MPTVGLHRSSRRDRREEERDRRHRSRRENSSNNNSRERWGRSKRKGDSSRSREEQFRREEEHHHHSPEKKPKVAKQPQHPSPSTKKSSTERKQPEAVVVVEPVTQPRKGVPTNLLSFGEEVEEGQSLSSDFSIGKSTAKRFAKERTLVLPTPMPSEQNRPNGLKVQDLDALDNNETTGLESKSISRVYLGSCQAIGCRPYMEDRHTVIPDFQPTSTNGGRISDGVGRSFAAVFDGHNGAGAAEALSSELHLILASDPVIRMHTGEGPPATLRKEEEDISRALKKAFKTMDDRILSRAREDKINNGSTAVVAFRLQDVLYTANAGDSRAVLCRGGKAIRLTEDHKPNLPAEEARIVKQGGRVEFQACWRVILDGGDSGPTIGLAVSRCLGDLPFKEPNWLIDCEPDVCKRNLTSEDEFIILASDGLWDVMSDQEAVDVARAELKKSSTTATLKQSAHIDKASAAVVDASIAKRTMDNITCVIMQLCWA